MNEHAIAVSIADAARLLGLKTRESVYALLADGKLRSFRVGRRRLIALAELERFAERQTTIQNAKAVPSLSRRVRR